MDYKPMFRRNIAMFSASKVIITDRLHSSILAFLLHKPHIYLDQMYGKISKTREVAFASSPNCRDKKAMRYDSADTISEAVMKALLFI